MTEIEQLELRQEGLRDLVMERVPWGPTQWHLWSLLQRMAQVIEDAKRADGPRWRMIYEALHEEFAAEMAALTEAQASKA